MLYQPPHFWHNTVKAAVIVVQQAHRLDISLMRMEAVQKSSLHTQHAHQIIANDMTAPACVLHESMFVDLQCNNQYTLVSCTCINACNLAQSHFALTWLTCRSCCWRCGTTALVLSLWLQLSPKAAPHLKRTSSIETSFLDLAQPHCTVSSPSLR